MFVITLWVLDCPQPVVLRYLDGARAGEVLAGVRSALAGTTVDVADEFGVQASVPRGRLLVPVLTDVAGAHRGNAAMREFEARFGQKSDARAEFGELPAGLVGP